MRFASCGLIMPVLANMAAWALLDRVMQVLSSGRPGWHANTMYLNCGGSRSREIWHDENIDGADFLVTVEFEKGGEAGGLLIDIYKRCPEIPVGEILFSDIPGTDTRR